MNQELTTSLADEIRRAHELSEGREQYARASIEELIEARVETATLVEAARASVGKGQFREWWETNKLPAGWAARYLKLAKTAKRHTLGDKNQMRLIGIIPTPEPMAAGEHQRQADNPFQWVKIAGRLVTTLTADRISAMDAMERETAKMRLKPIVELYEKLDAGF